MSGSQRDPNAEAFYQAISSVPRPGRTSATPPAEARSPTPAPAGGAFITLALIIAAPASLFLGAWALIELMTQLPLTILGGCLIVAGALVWALCADKRPLRIEDDDCLVITSLFESRFER